MISDLVGGLDYWLFILYCLWDLAVRNIGETVILTLTADQILLSVHMHPLGYILCWVILFVNLGFATFSRHPH